MSSGKLNRRRLFYDIETTPNIGTFWRAGYGQTITHDQILFEREIICISYKWEDDDECHTIDWRDGQEHMIKKFITVLNQSNEAVAHNGDRFDIRWVRGMALQYNIPMSPTTKTIDTLKIARKYFELNSKRLDYLGKLLLGEGKIHTDYDMWKDLKLQHTLNALFGEYLEKLTDQKIYKALEGLRRKADQHLNDMIDYCEEDVRLLERVFKKLWNYSNNYTHYGVLNGGQKYTCPECGSIHMKLSKTRVTAKGTVQRQMVCNSCGKFHTISDKAWQDLVASRTDMDNFDNQNSVLI